MEEILTSYKHVSKSKTLALPRKRKPLKIKDAFKLLVWEDEAAKLG